MSTSTDRQELGELLKKLRVNAGISGRELARRSFVSQPKISRIESGRVAPSPSDIEAITRELEADPDTIALAQQLARRITSPYRSLRLSSEVGWRSEQRDLRGMEQASEHIRFFLPAMLTGLLQTRDYAYAAVTGAVQPGGDPDLIVEHKMARQAILHSPTRFTFLLMPAALDLQLVEPEAMRAQLRRLLEVSYLPNVSLRVVDTTGLVREGPMNTFVIYDDRLVTAEMFSGSLTLNEAEDVVYHRRIFDYFLSVAHDEKQTRVMVQNLAGRP